MMSTPADSLPTPEKPGDAEQAADHTQRGSLTGRMIRRLLRAAGSPPVQVRLWNGECLQAGSTAPVASVRIADRATLWRMVRDPQMAVADSYCSGQLDIDGDLVEFMNASYAAMARAQVFGSRLHRLVGWLHPAPRNTLNKSRNNIHRHYDIGNDFYALWLGETMAYTCAYFSTPSATLEQAQTAKMDHVCRKLRLQSGETVVEAGCGWGSLALHMAARYGVRVRAFNISAEQIAFARERCQAQGLASQVEFVADDYRNMGGVRAHPYDAFVSVGMLEHVGREHYEPLGRLINEVLAVHGRGLIHSIGRIQPARTHPWIERRIFPGAYMPSLGEMMRIFEPAQLSVLDVENLRLHYAMTLRHWRERFEAVADRVRAMFDEKFVRMWRLYLNGSIAAFESDTTQLYQVLFARRHNNHIPLTRDYLYRD
jgi:cyclopropane-fatty-acyl-phospholipid synthase